MESQQQPELVQVSDTVSEQALAKFVAENRQHLPPLPERVSTTPREFTPTAPEVLAEREARQAQRAELRRQADLRQRAIELLQAAGARYRDCTLDNFRCDRPRQREVVTAMREYLDGDCCCGVILYGPVGTGKDHLAFAVCRAAVKAGKTLRWINGQDWFGRVRDAMDTDKSEASMIFELARPELLCISDPLPPSGPLTQFQSTMLYRVIDARYSRGLPTICTVNVANDSEADERLGAATWDRLTHDAWKLRCDWPSYRKPSREV